jgi:hypothetical protein
MIFTERDDGSFAYSLKVGDLVKISTKEKPYKITGKEFAGDEPRLGPLWLLALEESTTGNNKHNDYIRPDGTSMYYFRSLSISNETI